MAVLITETTVCCELGLESQTLRRWIEAGLVVPAVSIPEPKFTAEQVRRIWSIMSLERDLEVNLAGIDIILEMRSQIQMLRLALRRSSQHLQHRDRLEQFRIELHQQTQGPALWEVDLGDDREDPGGSDHSPDHSDPSS